MNKKSNVIFRKEYEGYEIIKQTWGRGGYADYYFIRKDGERISQICLNSPKAAINVINTHLRNISENQKPIYK